MKTLSMDDGSGKGFVDHNVVTLRGRFSNYYSHVFELRPIVAKMTFADGSQKTVRYDVPEFSDPADDGIWMNHKIHPVGDGKQSAFTLTVRAPVNDSIAHVEYELDGGQDHFTYKQLISEWCNYPISGMADKDFRARATVHVFCSAASRPLAYLAIPRQKCEGSASLGLLVAAFWRLEGYGGNSAGRLFLCQSPWRKGGASSKEE